MSNKIVPGIYRSVIDEVMAAIKPEFEEYGVSEDVLAELQSKWEHKVIASHVADFETPPAAPHPPQHHPYPTHPMHIMQGAYAAPPYVQQPPPPGGVKTEPVDTRYMLSQPISYALPPLPGPQLNGARQSQQSPQYGGQTSVLSFPPGPPPVQAMPTNGAGVPLGRPYIPPTAAASSSPSAAPATSSTPSTTATPSTAVASSGGGGSGGRIPQLDGPASDDSDEDDTPPPPSYAPRSSHPSLPQPQASTSSNVADSEAINSDLDDDDTGDEEEAEEGGAGETDIVFCTYDKVARVKNKWKCILKDGMIHVNGKDYLFSKCTGEFEW